MNKEGKALTSVKSIERSKESVSQLLKGEQAALSLPNVIAGRQLFEHDILYSAIPEEQFRQMKALTRFLKGDEIQALREIAEIKRKEQPLWGI